MPHYPEFTALRSRAKEKRDKIVAAAYKDYQAALVAIAKLEQELTGRESTRNKSISCCIQSVIPKDRPFNTVDIVAALEALDPARVWNRRMVDHVIGRLREKGLVRRLKKSRCREPALYALVGLHTDPIPFENMTLPEAVAATLTRPMTPTEVTVALVEAGYETSMQPAHLRVAVTRALHEGPFKKEGQKWMRA